VEADKANSTVMGSSFELLGFTETSLPLENKNLHITENLATGMAVITSDLFFGQSKNKNKTTTSSVACRETIPTQRATNKTVCISYKQK